MITITKILKLAKQNFFDAPLFIIDSKNYFILLYLSKKVCFKKKLVFSNWERSIFTALELNMNISIEDIHG